LSASDGAGISTFHERLHSGASQPLALYGGARDRTGIGVAVTFQEDIDALKRRIAQAESKRETWRLAGDKEKYLEAYFMVEALELQLDQRMRQPR
jgi:hypothetical protein